MRYATRASGERPAPSATSQVPRRTATAADRGGHGLRGLLGQRVDPLPPAVAVPASTEVGAFTPIEREEWVPDAHVHRLADINARSRRAATRSLGRRLLMFNDDVEIVDLPSPTRGAGRLLPQRRGRRGHLRPRGLGRAARRCSARVPYREHDYVVIPRGTTYRFRLDAAEQLLADASTRRARSRRRTATATATASCSSTRRSRSATSTRPTELETHRRARRATSSIVRVRGGYQHYVLDYHPLDVVGWDGYVYPYTFNIDDFEPAPAASTCRRPRTRPSRARTS